MKLNINKENIIEGLQKAAGIIPAKTGAAYLRTIWLEGSQDSLKIMSTDSKLEFSGTYSAKSQETGLIGVQGRSFYELCRKLPPGEINITTDPENTTLLLEQGTRKYKLPTHDPYWFKDFRPFPEHNAVLWSGDYLRELIDKISFCISDDNSDKMHNMKFTPIESTNEIEVCGLNGHQFAMQKFLNQDIYDILGQDGLLIAKSYIMELKKWLNMDEIFFTKDEKRIFFTNKYKNEVFSLPINYNKFPKYELFFSYFEDETSKMRIDRNELLSSLDRISIFNTEAQRCSYFVFDNNELVIYSQAQDTGEATESIPINYQGNIEKILFPTKNLIDTLNHFYSDEVQFELTKTNGPCMITGENDKNYMVIIMPIEIEEETYYTEEEID